MNWRNKIPMYFGSFLPCNLRGRSAYSWLIVALGIFISVSCENQESTQAGVVGTGNATRIYGVVQSNGVGVSLETRLIRVVDQQNLFVGARFADSGGAFMYDSLMPGDYFVEAWLDGVVCGRSTLVHLTRSVTDVVVIIVKPMMVNLNLQSLGVVDSVYLDYQGNSALKVDSMWQLRLFEDPENGRVADSGVLYTKVIDSRGSPTWLAWRLVDINGSPELNGLTIDTVIRAVFVDTSVFFPSRHTVALWSFDSLNSLGRIRDQGSYRNDLLMPSGDYLVPSPHGFALAFETMPSAPLARVTGDTIGTSLQWWRTGVQSIRARIKVDRPPSGAVDFLQFSESFRISLNADMQLEFLVRNSSQNGWNWNSYVSMIGAIQPKSWVEFTVSRIARDSSLSLWVDGKPQSVYLINQADARGFQKISKDTFVISNNRSVFSMRMFLDEVEISDTLPVAANNGTSLTDYRYYSASQGGVKTISFGRFADFGGVIRIDSSDRKMIGDSSALFIKFVPGDELAGRSIVRAGLEFMLEDAVLFQQYSVFSCFASAEKKIWEHLLLIPGVDYDTLSPTYGFSVGTGNAAVKATISGAARKWTQSPDMNHGVIVLPTHRGQGERRVHGSGAAINSWIQ